MDAKMGFSAAFREETLYRVAPSYAEHSVFTGLGEIKQPCPRPLSERGLVRTSFSSLAFCAGRFVFVFFSCDSESPWIFCFCFVYF